MKIRWTFVARVAVIACAVAAPLALVARGAFSPRAIVVLNDGRAPWIMARSPVSTFAEQAGLDHVPVTRFDRVFQLGSPATRATVTVRTFGDARLWLNSRLIDSSGPAGLWREARVADVTGILVPGRNVLHAEIANIRGPALLSLRLDGAGDPIVTGPGWFAACEDQPLTPAVPPDDTRPEPSSVDGPAAADALRAHSGTVAILFLFGVAGGALLFTRARAGAGLRRRFPALFRDRIQFSFRGRPLALSREQLPALALGLVVLTWLALFVLSFARIPLRPGFGFDIRGHLEYVNFVREKHAIPLASDGWSMFHPPLFYVVGALLESLFALAYPQGDAATAMKVLPFCAGLGNAFVAAALARRLWRSPEVAALAAVFAAALPVNLYTAAYPSNEAPHAFIAGVALVATVGLIFAHPRRPSHVLVVGCLLALALLTKVTALAVVAACAFFFGVALLAIDRLSPVRAAGQVGLLLLPTAVLAGPYYARNVVAFGRPFVTNFDVLSGGAWWSQPGFHTTAYYTGFGVSLVRPIFCFFHSFWDALYATLFCDAGLGGRSRMLLDTGPFDWRMMAGLPLIAAPVLFLVAGGGGLALADVLRRGEPRRRTALALVLGLSAILLFLLTWLTLELPFFGQAKAQYALAAVGPMAALFASGSSALLTRARGAFGFVVTAAFGGWFVAYVGFAWLSFVP